MKFKYQKLPSARHNPAKPFVPRPYIPIYLIGKSKRTVSPYYALLDSGADTVIFPPDLAKEVGITDIKSGKYKPSIGIGSQKLDVYYHNLKLLVLGEGRELPTEVGFAHNLPLPILGRSFFIHYKSVVFNETKEQVELKP